MNGRSPQELINVNVKATGKSKVCFSDERPGANNFNMSHRLSPEKQRQKADLVFKYVKALKPFEQQDSSGVHEAELALKRFNDSLKEKRQPVMELSSRVYQLKLGSKSKRVTFLDQLQDHKKLGNPNDGYRSVWGQFEDPEKIKSELLQLQKSVYSSFNIQSTHQLDQRSIFQNLHIAESLLLQSNSNLASAQIPKEGPRDIPKPPNNSSSTPFKVIRSKSELLLSSRIKQSPASPIRKELSSSRPSHLSTNKPSGNRNLANRSYQSTSSRMQSASEASLQSPLKMTVGHSKVARTDKFWKQQNNLMVQIFKNKLQLKKEG